MRGPLIYPPGDGLSRSGNGSPDLPWMASATQVGDIAGGDYVEVTNGGAVVLRGAAHKIYGSMYCEDTAIGVSAAAIHTYYPVASGLLDGGSNGFTFQNDKELKCVVPGKYLAIWSMSIRSGESDTTIEGIVIVGDTAQENTGNATKAKENNVVYSVGGAGIIDLAVDDLVRLGIERENGAATTITVNHATLALIQVGGIVPV